MFCCSLEEADFQNYFTEYRAKIKKFYFFLPAIDSIFYDKLFLCLLSRTKELRTFLLRVVIAWWR